MNQKIMKRMVMGAVLAMVLQCQVAMAACSSPPYQGDRAAIRCLPA